MFMKLLILGLWYVITRGEGSVGVGQAFVVNLNKVGERYFAQKEA
jgi:hypothetical protein